jgi:hypothetical protein
MVNRTTQYPVVENVEWDYANMDGFLEIVGNHTTADQNTYAIEDELGSLFSGQDIVRLEFLWNDAACKRGIVAIDANGDIVVHIVPALLGYTGAGSNLSHAVLQTLKVPEEVFEAIQSDTYQRRPYIIAVNKDVATGMWSWEREQ